jgi:hypothetical protein
MEQTKVKAVVNILNIAIYFDLKKIPSICS